MIMELVSPLTFLYTFYTSPLSYVPPSLPPLISPQSILVVLYLVHYANRAVLSPLRTPSRSKSHIVVPLAGIIFNLLNGSLMGSYLSSPFARIWLVPSFTFARPTFWIGLALWAVGFWGNIAHDEILLDIRRKAKAKGKGKAESGSESESDDQPKAAALKPKKETKQPAGEYYAIPQGLLFSYVSYPNYFCEWIEWLGFALAAAPFPIAWTSMSLKYLTSVGVSNLIRNIPSTLSALAFNPAYHWAPNLSPPYIFLITEILLMFPRAWNGHRWYRERFGDRYPKERKVVVPFLI